MQLGAHTFGFVWHSDAESALVAIAEAGFKQVQLMATPPHFDPWAEDHNRTRRLSFRFSMIRYAHISDHFPLPLGLLHTNFSPNNQIFTVMDAES